jgi:hypothetical protein
MKKLTLITILLAVMLPVAIWAQCAGCPTKEGKSDDSVKMSSGKSDSNSKIAAVALPGYNKPVQLPDSKYFKYSFASKPKMGTSILNVSVYDKKNRLSDDFEVFISADMPSMRGAHDSGDVKMKANKKGVLLTPINFVMPGVWEVTLKFFKEGKHTNTFTFELKI